MKPRRPAPLTIVAWIFILAGISAGVEIFLALRQNRISLNFGVLGIFIGFGLLNFKPGWRLLALISLWLAMIMGPVICLVALANPGALEFKLLGEKIADVSPAVFGISLLAFFIFTVWQYRVLTRPDIRELFYRRGQPCDPVDPRQPGRDRKAQA